MPDYMALGPLLVVRSPWTATASISIQPPVGKARPAADELLLTLWISLTVLKSYVDFTDST